MATDRERFAMAIGALADRLVEYMQEDGPCTCGDRKQHPGWLKCAVPDIPSTPENERAVEVGFALGQALHGEMNTLQQLVDMAKEKP